MKKISRAGIALAYHIASFLVVLTALMIIKAGISIYWRYKLAKDGYKPILIAIDKLEFTIERTNPLIYMSIGGLIVFVLMIIIGWALIDWHKLAQEMDIVTRLKQEVIDLEAKK